MVYPEFPGKGDTIGICAPSFGVGDALEYFDLSMETLKDEGFNIIETDSVRNAAYPSASAEIRGAEFNSLFDDDNIDIVIAASGGDYNIEMVPYIDQELVKSHPKWFSGYSDPTSIEMLLTTVLDIATIYGVNAGAWDWRPLHKFQKDALAVIKGKMPVQTSYDMWCSEGFLAENALHQMDAPVKWTLLRGSEDGFKQEKSLDVSGRLIGGCIDVIDFMIGTPYEDLTGFCDRYKDDGLIWFFDNYEYTPMTLMYTAYKMKNMGLFDHAKAVIFGRTCFPGEATDDDYLLQMGRVFADLDVPVIWGADIGHTKPSFTLINGAIGHLRYENGRAELSMELR